jgi:DNA-binding SARP family transcriptional activator
LLAALLVDAGRAVTVNDLMTAMWDGWPAATARTQIQGGVSALRRHFAEAPFARAARPPRIEYGTVGYTLRLGAHELDADVFRARVARGYAERERGEFAAAAETLRGALALWRGPALAGLDGARLRARANRLEESRLTAAETMLRLWWRLGRTAEVLDALPDLVAAYPLSERLAELEMRALVRAGRRADALLAYARLRERLADALGLDPGAELVALHRDILRGRAEQAAPIRRVATPRRRATRVRVSPFPVGRSA